MQDNKDERDSFWDLSKLVPKKKEYIPPFKSVPSVSDFEISGEENQSRETKLSFSKNEKQPLYEEKSYEPKYYQFIKKVSIKKLVDKYDFYDNFRKAANVYFEYKTDKCDFVPFYSYMPQYSQLTKEQKNYYFYWRDCVRHGKFIRSDYSYIYLYVYEILNLPEKIFPKEGVRLLCRLWSEYRQVLRRIDSYFSIWVQDYCLIYDLECPMDIIGDFIFDVIEVSSFKEFYISNTEHTLSHGVDAMISFLSDYDWRRGKFVDGTHAELYKKHMHGAMSKIIEDVFSDGFVEKEAIATTVRDAFPHSLCTHAVKCKIAIEYYPMSRALEIRNIFTGCVRYTENKLRALIGVKSRLAVKMLGEEYKLLIDRYFNDLVSSAEKRRVVRSVPEYEKLYDKPDEIFSTIGADEIEKMSWNTTARLVSESCDCEIIDDKTEQSDFVSNAFENEHDENNASENFGLDSFFVQKIREALGCGFHDDAAAEKINEAFADGFGDIILELGDDGYVVIDDYREDVEEWLKQMK